MRAHLVGEPHLALLGGRATPHFTGRASLVLWLSSLILRVTWSNLSHLSRLLSVISVLLSLPPRLLLLRDRCQFALTADARRQDGGRFWGRPGWAAAFILAPTTTCITPSTWAPVMCVPLFRGTISMSMSMSIISIIRLPSMNSFGRACRSAPPIPPFEATKSVLGHVHALVQIIDLRPRWPFLAAVAIMPVARGRPPWPIWVPVMGALWPLWCRRFALGLGLGLTLRSTPASLSIFFYGL